MLTVFAACDARSPGNASAPARQPAATAAHPTEESALLKQARALFAPLPDAAASPVSTAKVALGKSLYFDPRLSRGNSVSCNSCHNVASYGVDNLPVSPGHKGQLGTRNSPSTFNAGLHAAQFWDGRAPDLDAQALGPILNPVEMALPHEDVAVATVASIDGYRKAFDEVYAGEATPLTYRNIGNAIAEYERTLLTPGPFDRYLKGDVDALNAMQKAGLKTFIGAGCVACHAGPAVGGQSFHKFGLVEGPYWKHTGSRARHTGRHAVTKKEEDKYVFKAPSLRNVAVTYPYFHDGSVWSLDDAIEVMGRTQLGRTFSQKEVAEMRAFLDSLTGSLPADAMTLPQLPAASEATRRPDPT